MRTTLDLPKDLLDEALAITGLGTKTDVIKFALNELIKRNELIKLREFKGKVDLTMDLDVVRERNESYR